MRVSEETLRLPDCKGSALSLYWSSHNGCCSGRWGFVFYLETYFQKRQKISRSLCHQSAIWQARSSLSASISNKQFPAAFLKWLRKKKKNGQNIPCLLFPADFKVKSFTSSMEWFVLPEWLMTLGLCWNANIFVF